MIRFVLAFVAGVLLFQFQPRLPHAGLFAAYALVLLGGLRLPWLRLPAWLVLGFAWAHGHAWLTRPAPLPPWALDGAVWIEGRVDSLVEGERGYRRFVFVAGRVTRGELSSEGEWRLRLGWYRDVPTLSPGEGWRLRVRLKPASSYANPGAFDYVRWLYAQGIRYRGSVRVDPGNHRLAGAQSLGLDRLRQGVAAAIGTALPQRPGAAALLQALTVGDRRGFSAADWRVFRATGTNHLVAISGLHVGIVAGLALAVVGGLWRRQPRLCGRWPARQAGAIAAWLAALLYAGLAGFAVPTLRALLMLSVALLALLGGREHRVGDALALALLAVVASSPMAVGNAGLWLSFAAVALIVWSLAAAAQRSLPLWLRWGRLQLAIGIGLVPLLLYWFQQTSLLAPLVNLIAIPLFSLLLVPAALLTTAAWCIWEPLGVAGWQAWAWLAQPVLDLLGRIAGLHWAELQWPAPGVPATLLGLAGLFVLLMPRGVPARWLGALLLMPLLCNRPAGPARGEFFATVLDVGQGLAVVVRTASHLLVYDAGPRYRFGFNTGDAVVAPYLRHLGVARIDRLVASHADSDHSGGVPALRRSFEVGDLLAGEPAELPGARPCAAGQRWRWDGIEFRVLHPAARQREEGNNASCVLRISAGSGSLLLTGDIEASAEQQLLADGMLRRTTVVVAPHHGSRTSSTAGFVAALAPRHVVYTSGRDNRWGFPKADVVGRWRAAGATAWDTASDGAVEIRFRAAGDEPQIRGYRARHYWNP